MTEKNKDEEEKDEEVNDEEEEKDEKVDEEGISQSEADRRISKAVESALEKNNAKRDKEIEETIEKERKEAIEYEKLTQKEKEEAKLTKREQELEDGLKELNDARLKSQIEDDLKDKNLPLSLADTLLSVQDNEKIKGKIVDIKKEFDEAVNVQVKEALRQDTPSSSTTDKKTSTKLDEMTLTERIAYKNENPTDYNRLMGK